MKRSELSRRDFNKLTVAAFGGMVAGTAIGCGGQDGGGNGAAQNQQEGGGTGGSGGGADGGGTDGAGTGGGAEIQLTAAEQEQLLAKPHVCRGLNACKGKGKSGENQCAGQGTCFTATKHTCAGMNACKGQGGCGEKPGANSCEGKGECAVPLNSRETWDKARKALETALKADEGTPNKLGKPPEMGPPTS